MEIGDHHRALIAILVQKDNRAAGFDVEADGDIASAHVIRAVIRGHLDHVVDEAGKVGLLPA